MKKIPQPDSDRDVLVSGVHELIEMLRDWLETVANFDWDGSQGFLPIIRRSSLIRQADALEIMADLVASNRGYAAVSLLRPSCEELLWLRYLKGIDATAGNDLIDCLMSSGLLKDLEAQVGKIGSAEMSEPWLEKRLTQFRSKTDNTRTNLISLGKKLGWPKEFTKNGKMPSTWYFAKETSSEDIYRFLYHATSRYVHFSPVELGRRGWGKDGKLKITSSVYEPHWAVFSLQWGARLFGFTIDSVLEPLAKDGLPEPPHGLLEPIFHKICKVPLIPLITADELHWEAPKNSASQMVAADN